MQISLSERALGTVIKLQFRCIEIYVTLKQMFELAEDPNAIDTRSWRQYIQMHNARGVS